jgi:hypothetical protein
MRKGRGSGYDKWNIHVVICDIYSIAINQVIVATVTFEQVMTSTLPKGTLGAAASLLAVDNYSIAPSTNISFTLI